MPGYLPFSPQTGASLVNKPSYVTKRILDETLFIAGLLILASPTAFARGRNLHDHFRHTCLNLNFPQTSISAKDNVPGKTMVDMETTQRHLQVNCSCDSKHRLKGFRQSTTQRIQLAVKYVIKRLVSLITILIISRYRRKDLHLGVGYTVPFEHVSNRSTASHTCGSSNEPRFIPERLDAIILY
jgi:hypothetical protein